MAAVVASDISCRRSGCSRTIQVRALAGGKGEWHGTEKAERYLRLDVADIAAYVAAVRRHKIMRKNCRKNGCAFCGDVRLRPKRPI